MKTNTIIVLACGAALAVGLAVGTQYTVPETAAVAQGPPAGASFVVQSEMPCTVSFTDQFGEVVYQEAEVGPGADGDIRLTPPLFEGMVIRVDVTQAEE